MPGTYPPSRVLGAALAALVPLIPALVGTVLVYVLFGTHPGWFAPYLTDEFNYWHQIATFAARGFDGGHYSVEEHPAAAAFTRFDVHGPVFVVIYGLIAKVVGWHTWSAPLFGMALLAGALAVYIRVGRLGALELGLTAGVLAVSWPLHTFLMTNMQEPFHDVVAIVLAAVVARMIADPGGVPVALRTMAITLVCVAALARPTWGVLLAPLLPLAVRARRPAVVAGAVAGAVALVLLLVAAYNFMAAPYPNIMAEFKLLYAQHPGRAWAHLAGFAGRNVPHLFSLDPTDPRKVLAAVQRFAVIALAGVSLGWLARAGLAWRRGRAPAAADLRLHLFQLVNLGGVLALCLLLRPLATYHDYRPLAPHLLLAVLVYVLARRRLVPGVYVAGYALFVVVFVYDYAGYHYQHFRYNDTAFYGPPVRALYKQRVADLVVYDPAADAWGNTLLVERGTYNRLLVAIAPEIGISRVLDWRRVRFPIRSKYVFIAPRTHEEIRDRTRLRLLSATPFGNLYLNLDNATVAARAGAPPTPLPAPGADPPR